MLITDKEQLKNFYADQRLWQGIPCIERTKKGRIYVAFFSGKIKEEPGNYTCLIKSDDDGKTFSEPVTVAYDGEDARCFDPTLWTDPYGRLWLTWNTFPEVLAYAAICNDPDAEDLVWSEPFVVGKGILAHKPTILSSGEWLFPVAVWDLKYKDKIYANNYKDKRAFAYSSADGGKTFIKLGGVSVRDRVFDEHLFIEHDNGDIDVFVRTTYGIGKSTSYDRCLSWTDGCDSGLHGPSSRFFMERLKNGKILFINHYDFKGRNNLTAMLSEDDGKTFPYRLLLDERDEVSYPDAVQSEDGSIYVVYDRERGSYKYNFASNRKAAKELLLAKITEEDIIAGKIVSENSFLKRIVNKLGVYKGKDKNPYGDYIMYSTEEYVETLMPLSPKKALEKILNDYSSCYGMLSPEENSKTDKLFDDLATADADEKRKLLTELVTLFRQKTGYDKKNDNRTINDILTYLNEHITENISVYELAEKFYMSFYYMCHLFKRYTNTTVTQYVCTRRIAVAKKMLENGSSVTEACYDSGFSDASYFTKTFKKLEGITPRKYINEYVRDQKAEKETKK